MSDPFFYGVGGVVSADIAVPNHDRQLSFYSSVLTTGDRPLWREDLMNNQGTPVIGLGKRTPELEFLPLQWMPHFQVADIKRSATTTVQLGGTVLMQSAAEDTHGEWAVLVDPAGAGFGVIPVVPGQLEKQRCGQIGGLSLHSANPSKSASFYSGVLGWTATPTEQPTNDAISESREMKTEGGRTVATIEPFPPDGEAIPEVWLLHLPVDDLKSSLERVVAQGGAVVTGSVESGSALIRDPEGIYFQLQKTDE